MSAPVPPPPRRKGFQIHLSTALILMLAAGGLIWANVRPKCSIHTGTFYFPQEQELVILMPDVEPILKETIHNYGKIEYIARRRLEYGFPAIVVGRNSFILDYEHRKQLEFEFNTQIIWSNLYINLVTALFILFTIWLVCEWWIRRREASAKMRDGK